MTTLIFVLLSVGICGSFFFAGVETGFLSWNPLKVSYRASQGDIYARWALHLLKYKERVLSTVLIGNNISIVVATLTFVYLFTQLDQAVKLDLGVIPSPETWILSPVMVIFTEMLPKSLFRIYSFRLTIKSIPVLIILYWIFLPVTWMFSLIGRIFQSSKEGGKTFATNVRREMVLLAQEGSKRGTLFEYATIFIDNIFKLKDKTIEYLAQPENSSLTGDTADTAGKKRVKTTDTVSDIFQGDYSFNHDRILVYDENGKRAFGWATVLDLARADKNTKIADITRPLAELQEDNSLLKCFSKEASYKDPYYRIINKNGYNGLVISRYDLFRVVFGGYNSI
jgi:CBS domain containing-hemolysin-like protein